MSFGDQQDEYATRLMANPQVPFALASRFPKGTAPTVDLPVGSSKEST